MDRRPDDLYLHVGLIDSWQNHRPCSASCPPRPRWVLFFKEALLYVHQQWRLAVVFCQWWAREHCRVVPSCPAEWLACLTVETTTSPRQCLAGSPLMPSVGFWSRGWMSEENHWWKWENLVSLEVSPHPYPGPDIQHTAEGHVAAPLLFLTQGPDCLHSGCGILPVSDNSSLCHSFCWGYWEFLIDSKVNLIVVPYF